MCVELIALTTNCSTALRSSAIIIIIIIIWPREKHIKRITRRKKECTRGGNVKKNKESAVGTQEVVGSEPYG